ncbi:MAG: hypothetical protein IT186_25090 [Acidobacteria bacterium]|nr:hypothetical protein [Acidobacteriota bacterium]
MTSPASTPSYTSSNLNTAATDFSSTCPDSGMSGTCRECLSLDGVLSLIAGASALLKGGGAGQKSEG